MSFNSFTKNNTHLITCHFTVIEFAKQIPKKYDKQFLSHEDIRWGWSWSAVQWVKKQSTWDPEQDSKKSSVPQGH